MRIGIYPVHCSHTYITLQADEKDNDREQRMSKYDVLPNTTAVLSNEDQKVSKTSFVVKTPTVFM